MLLMKKLITTIAVLLIAFVPIVYSQVTVVQDSFFAPSIQSTSKFLVVLPDGYAKSHERYATVYLLHGWGGDYTNWVKLTDLVRYAKSHNFIFIAPDAKNSWYTNSISQPDAKYEDFIIKDVIPFIDGKYRTNQSKFNRAIVGLSMGGYGAAKFGLKYSRQFFFAGCLSPAIHVPYGLEDTSLVARRSKESIQGLKDIFGSSRNDTWPDNDVFTLVEKANPKTAPYFYLAMGSQDGLPEILDLTPKFAAALRKAGIPFEMHETAGAHDWKFWDKEIEIVLKRISEVRGKK
jgi:S-formylglutathione hydrolase FrmB